MQAKKQSELPRPTMSSSIFYSSLDFQNERIHRNLPRPNNLYNHKQQLCMNSWWCAKRSCPYFGLIEIQRYYSFLCVCSLSYGCDVIHAWMRRPRYFPAALSSWHLQIVKFTKSWTSVRRMFCFIWSSVAGGCCPRSEALCTAWLYSGSCRILWSARGHKTQRPVDGLYFCLRETVLKLWMYIGARWFMNDSCHSSMCSVTKAWHVFFSRQQKAKGNLTRNPVHPTTCLRL